jgi:hypothetical protein
MAMSFALWRSDHNEQFPITVDEKVLKMLGYTLKGNFKRDLLKDFGDGEGVDWSFIKSDEPNEMTLNNVNGPGKAWRAETIKITGDVFKSMALRSNSSIGKASRSYFVSLENIMFCYMQASNEWKTAKQIAAKDTEMKQLQQVIQEKDMELEAGRVPFSNRQPLQSVYVFTNDTYEKINLYKIGETHSGKAIKRIKQQQPGSPEDLRLIFEARTINSKILETAVHSVLSQLNCHANGEWFQAPIGKIRGIIRGLNNTLNIALTVENATEEEIVEQLMNYRHEPTVPPVANQVMPEVNMKSFVKDTYVEISERGGIESDSVEKDYIAWVQRNGLRPKIPSGFKRDLDLAFAGRELDKNSRRFWIDGKRISGWSGWKRRT